MGLLSYIGDLFSGRTLGLRGPGSQGHGIQRTIRLVTEDPEGSEEGMAADLRLNSNTGTIYVKTTDGGSTGWRILTSTNSRNPAVDTSALITSLATGIRSLSEFGGVSDGSSASPTDNLGALQALVAAVSADGGGVALIPAGDYLFTGTLTLPPGVILQGLGFDSILRARPAVGMPAINFTTSTCRAEIHHLSLLGDPASVVGIGIDYTASLFNRVSHVQVWDFAVGVRFSDGVTQFSAYNELASFEINRCTIGLQALLYCNGCNVSKGRIFFSLGGSGIGVDIDGGLAVVFDSVDVEASDTSIRIRGLVDVSIRGGFWETGDAARFLFDIVPTTGSKISFTGITPSATNAIPMDFGLDEIMTWDIFDSYPFGAKRHYAASNAQNLIENGDFQQADGITTIPRWGTSGSPTLAENTADYVTAGRSYTVTQAATANDGLSIAGVAYAGVDNITVCVRFKKLTSGAPLFSLTSGGNVANWDGADSRLAASADDWRIATMNVAVDPAANGAFTVVLTADQSSGGGQIRVDEVWAVGGRTAGASRQHGNRIQLLETQQEIFSITGTASNGVFGPINLAALTGLSQPPRGAIGARIRLVGRVNGGSIGDLRTTVVTPYVDTPNATGGAANQLMRLMLTTFQVYTSIEFDVRTMSLTGGLNFPSGAGASTDYYVYLVGWILPH